MAFVGDDGSVGMISPGFNLTVAFPTVFVTLDDRFTHVQALIVGALGLAGLIAGIMVGGALADRFGARPVAGLGYLLWLRWPIRPIT